METIRKLAISSRKKGSEVITVLGILGVVVVILAIFSTLVFSYVGKSTAKTTLNEITSSISTQGTTITDTGSLNDFKKSVEKLSGEQFTGSLTSVTLVKTVGGNFDNEFTIELDPADTNNSSLVKSAFSKLSGVKEVTKESTTPFKVTVKTETPR